VGANLPRRMAEADSSQTNDFFLFFVLSFSLHIIVSMDRMVDSNSSPQHRLATLATVAMTSSMMTACAITYFQRRAARLAIQSVGGPHEVAPEDGDDASCRTVTSNPLWESPNGKRPSSVSNLAERSPAQAKAIGGGRTRGGGGAGGGRPDVRDPYDPRPRSDYLSWDDYFMAVAFLSSQRSKDPNKQVGACIVDRQNVICGIGYNGFPRGCPDSQLPWSKLSKSGSKLDTKYPYVCHAEMNAILNKNNSDVAGSRVYVTMFPCNECAKLMIQAGIAEIVFHEDKVQPKAETPGASNFKLADQYSASKKLLALAGVKIRQHVFKRDICLSLTNDGIVGMEAMSSIHAMEGGDLLESSDPVGSDTGRSLVTRFD